jgi:hypothetical protein
MFNFRFENSDHSIDFSAIDVIDFSECSSCDEAVRLAASFVGYVDSPPELDFEAYADSLSITPRYDDSMRLDIVGFDFVPERDAVAPFMGLIWLSDYVSDWIVRNGQIFPGRPVLIKGLFKRYKFNPFFQFYVLRVIHQAVLSAAFTRIKHGGIDAAAIMIQGIRIYIDVPEPLNFTNPLR